MAVDKWPTIPSGRSTGPTTPGRDDTPTIRARHDFCRRSRTAGPTSRRTWQDAKPFPNPVPALGIAGTAIALLLQRQLAAIDVDLVLEPANGGELQKRAGSGKFEKSFLFPDDERKVLRLDIRFLALGWRISEVRLLGADTAGSLASGANGRRRARGGHGSAPALYEDVPAASGLARNDACSRCPLQRRRSVRSGDPRKLVALAHRSDQKAAR